MNDLSYPTDVERAEREVERRKAELSLSLQEVGKSGEQMARRFGHQLKPVLVGVAVVAGVAVLVGVTALVARRRRPVSWLAPQPSAFSITLRTVGIGFLRVVAQHAARTLAQRISAAALEATPAEPAQPAQ